MGAFISSNVVERKNVDRGSQPELSWLDYMFHTLIKAIRMGFQY